MRSIFASRWHLFTRCKSSLSNTWYHCGSPRSIGCPVFRLRTKSSFIGRNADWNVLHWKWSSIEWMGISTACWSETSEGIRWIEKCWSHVLYELCPTAGMITYIDNLHLILYCIIDPHPFWYACRATFHKPIANSLSIIPRSVNECPGYPF